MRKLEVIFDRGFYLLLMLYLVIDTFNGITLRYYSFSIGPLFKFPLALYMLYALMRRGNKGLILVVSLLAYVFLSSFLNFLNSQNLSYLLSDFLLGFKGIFPFLSFSFFLSEINYRKDIEQIFKKFIFISFIVIAVNFIAGLFGFGYYQYESLKIGTKGFFYAGNDISGVMIIVFSFMLYFAYRRGVKVFIFIALAIFALSILKATKTAIISSFVIAFFIPLSKEQGRWSTLTPFKMNYVAFSVLLVPIAMYFLYLGVIFSGLIDRLSYFSRRYDLVTFLLSSRNIDVQTGMEKFLNDYTILEKIFGKGQMQFSEYFNLLRNTVEIDFFDILFMFGLLGLIVFNLLWLIFLLGSFTKLKSKQFPYAFPALLSNLLLFLASLTAGHIFFSGIIGIFVGFSNAMVYYKQKID